jgi:type I restriction enzyme, S subunit
MTTGPRGWNVTSLQDVADLIRGVTYTKPEAKDRPHPGYIPLLRATNIGNELATESGLLYVPSERVSAAQLLQVDDIVLAASSGSVSVVGKSARLVSAWPGTFGAFCAVLRARPGIQAKYLALYVKSHAVRQRWSDAARGTNINNLKRDDLLSTPIPIPPLGEQRRIVDILEDHLSRLDAADSGLDAGGRKADAFGALIAEAAYRGSLVHEIVPIEEALGMPAASRRRRDFTAPRRCPEWPLPTGWSWASIDEVSALVIDGDHNPPRRVPTGVPHITAKGVRGGAIVLDGCTYVSAEGFAQTSARYRPVEGDVIVTCVGTIGRVAVVPPDLVFSADRNLAAVRLAPDRMLPQFLALILGSVSLQRHMHGASGSTAQPHLYLKDLRSLPVVVPPLETQAGLVSAAHELLASRARFAKEIAVTRLRLMAMRRSLLTAAFSGRLTGTSMDTEIIEELAGV